MDYDVELERATRPYDPEALLDFFVVRALRGEAIEETFDVITSEHGVPVEGQMSIPYGGSARLFLGRPDALPLRRRAAPGEPWLKLARGSKIARAPGVA
jgi:hypothetical protein